MASAWGNSWASAWGNSWGLRSILGVVLDGDAGHKRKKRNEFEERRKAFDESRKALITELIGKALAGEVVPDEISAPVLKTTAGKVEVSGETVTVDWAALKSDMDNLYALLDAYKVFMENEDDEEALLML